MTRQAMSPLTRPGPGHLGTLCAELLAGNPRLALKQAGGNPVDAGYAHLLAGEPKRALRAIASLSGVPRLAAALRAWAWQLDQNTYPGGIGAELTLPSERPMASAAHDPEAQLVELLVREGPPSLSDPRFLIAAWHEMGRRADAADVATRVVVALGQASTHAHELGDDGLAWWTALAATDLRRRCGQVGEAMAGLAVLRESASDPALVALTRLVEGDWRATPAASPESLGFQLWTPLNPSATPAPTTGDLAAAADCYAEAARLLPAASPRLAGALELRWAALAFWGDQLAEYRSHLRYAGEYYESAGDRSGTTLVAAHEVIADLSEGRLAAHSLNLGSGWEPPASGPISRIRDWALSDGSQSWAVGLGRLLQRVGEAWLASGEQNRARVALLAALPLLTLNPRLPTRRVRTAVASLDLRRGSVIRALVSLERELISTDVDQPAPPDGDTLDEDAVSDAVQAIMVAATAQQSRVRTAAAQPAAEGLLRLKEQLTSLLTQPGMPDMTPAASGGGWRQILRGLLTAVNDLTGSRQQIFQVIVSTIGPLMATIDVHIALAHANQAQHLGRGDVATVWYDEALAVARGNPATPAHLVPVLLAAADRLPEARSQLDLMPTATAEDNLILAHLALRCGDQVRAAQALRRTGTLANGWRAALAAAAITLRQGDHAAALDRALAGIEDFEHQIGEMVRDPDRIAACDDPDVPYLYLTAAMAASSLAERSDFNAARIQRRHSFELAERMRALSLPRSADHPTGDPVWRAWQSASATWMQAAELVLASTDTAALDDQLAAERAADGRLLEAEARLEQAQPSFFARRSRPPTLPTAGDIQRSLDPGTLVLEYLIVGTDLMVWTMTSDQIRTVHRTINSRRLASAVRAYHHDCAQGRGDGTELAGTLLSPVADEVRGCRRLVIVPFGPLNLVPFHALPLDGQAIGLTRVISYTPTATPLSERAPDRPIDIRRGLVIGDPAHTATRGGSRVSRLAGAEAEARKIGQLLGTPNDRLLTGERATRAAVMGRLPGADLLHLATHGFLNEMAPFSSSVALAGSDHLNVADLVGMSITTKLAVLSGCDTGRGAATLGGDLVGLTRSLLQAGVEQVMVSLWPVDDDVTAVTMDLFYRRLTQGHPPAAALASAQRQLHSMSADAIRANYAELSGNAPPSGRRRGLIDLPPEFVDDEPLPEPLDGRAERNWAPFILVGT